MSYSSASDVASLAPHLVSGASTFDTSTSPTLNSVNAWLSSGCAIINSKLASIGYSAIPTNSAAYEFARQAEALFGAQMAERSRLSARVSDDENSRSGVFKKDFDSLLGMLVSMDLSRMGVTRGNKPPANWAGGIDVTDKDTNADDDTIVQSRFKRGAFRNVEVLEPLTSAS